MPAVRGKCFRGSLRASEGRVTERRPSGPALHSEFLIVGICSESNCKWKTHFWPRRQESHPANPANVLQKLWPQEAGAWACFPRSVQLSRWLGWDWDLSLCSFLAMTLGPAQLDTATLVLCH